MPQEPATKKCPFCAEEILADALKCKHCHEVLSVSPQKSTKKQEKPIVDRIAMWIFAGMVLLSLVGSISNPSRIGSVLIGAFLIYLLWFYPIKLATKLCIQKNRNPNKGALAAFLLGWIGYILLYLMLKTRDPRTNRLL